jgi:hypothetical protein
MTAVKVMVVAKLPRLKTFKVEAALPPLTIPRESGTAAMLKSWPGTLTVKVAG